MGTIGALLNVARNALLSNQAALDVTSNNVANQNTAGYTRETVSWSTDVVNIGSQTLGSGSHTGLTATSQRDRVLEQRVQQQTQLQSDSATRQSALNQLQSVFGLTSTQTSAVSTTLGDAINSFYNSFSALASSPADVATRQTVLSAASSLTSAFNAASSQVSAVNADLTQSSLSVTAQINGLTAEVARLNLKIGALSPDVDAGTLEDQRQQAIAGLSQLIGLDQVTTESNGITLSTTGGAVLVSQGQSFPLSISTAGGTATIHGGSTNANITTQIAGGQLGGLLEVQQTQIAPLLNSLDQLASTIATSVNTQNALGLDANGVAGQALFTLSATLPGTAATIQVATTDPKKIAAAALNEGNSGNSNANLIANLGTTALISGQTPETYFSGVLSALGTSVASATNDQTVQKATLDQLTTQRDALSGVSLDEEAANLTNYQRAYQASSKLFSILDTIFEAAINLGTETTV